MEDLTNLAVATTTQKVIDIVAVTIPSIMIVFAGLIGLWLGTKLLNKLAGPSYLK